MKVLGVTGGIGSGKSRVLSYLATFPGVKVYEADQIGAALQKRGTECFQKIVVHFGDKILLPSGELNRKALGEIVFSSPDELSYLNQIVHPAVQNQVETLLIREQEEGTALFVLEAALLLEAGYEKLCDEIWYVYATENIRIKRLKDSRGYSDQKCQSIMSLQNKESFYKKNANQVIDNSGSWEVTCEQVKNGVKSLLCGK